jgi:hypothetical protein
LISLARRWIFEIGQTPTNGGVAQENGSEPPPWFDAHFDSVLRERRCVHADQGNVPEPSLWRHGRAELKIIDVFICKLRKKLSLACGDDNYIETVWGRGYVLRDPEEVEQAQVA